jgi:taurine dioxygenase
MDIQIKHTDAPLGHEVQGLDLAAPLDDETFAAIEAAYDQYGTIVFRDQALSPEQQIAFSRRFGPLDRYVLDRYNHKTWPDIFVISNIIGEDGEPIGMSDAGRYWHTDMWLTHNPPRGSILYALEIPQRDGEPLGDTYFASTGAAYDALPAELRARLDNTQAVFSKRKYFEFRARTNKDIDKPTGQASQQALADLGDEDIVHTIVRRHPRTGRKCLYLCEGVISRLIGWDEAESDAMIAFLERHATSPEFVYRHRWRPGDLVMWDNCACIHKATGDFELPLRRHMHRTTLASATGAPA